MQKVEGSSPFSRFREVPASETADTDRVVDAIAEAVRQDG